MSEATTSASRGSARGVWTSVASFGVFGWILLVALTFAAPNVKATLSAGAFDYASSASKDAFASYNGTAPIDVSSGDQIRHRLFRAGNRRGRPHLPLSRAVRGSRRGSAPRQ